MATISSNTALIKTQEYFNKIASITNSPKDRKQVYKFVQGLYDLNLWDNMVCWLLRKDQNVGTGVIVYSLGGLGNYPGLIINTTLCPLLLEQNDELVLLQENGEILFATCVPKTDVWQNEGFLSTNEHSEYITIPNGARLLSSPNVSSGSVFKNKNTSWNDSYYWLYGNEPQWTLDLQNGGNFKEANGVGLINDMRDQYQIERLGTQSASSNAFQFFINVTSNTTTSDYKNNVLKTTSSIQPFNPGAPLPNGTSSYQIARSFGTTPNVTGSTCFHWVLKDTILTQNQINQLFELYVLTIGSNTNLIV
jgi:hypothetical protein